MNLSQSLRLTGFLVYLCFSLSSCVTTDSNAPNQNDDRMKKIIWGEIKDKPIFLYTLTNRNGLKAKITNYGAILTEFHAPDRNGKMADITLGFDKLEDYLPRHPYFGCICGRVANRIGQARFVLDGKEYGLTANYGNHHLHGGEEGFDKKIWTVIDETQSEKKVSLKMAYLSPNGEEGYPGTLDSSINYSLGDNNILKITMEARTDKPTIVNFAHHAYWNLSGHDSGNILNHELQINAKYFTPGDVDGVPTGAIKSVEGTPFDFIQVKTIGKDINKIIIADPKTPSGYDINLVLLGSLGQIKKVARAKDPISGRVMEVHSTEPGVQFYTGNYLDGSFIGKGGTTYQKHAGFCLETQHFPDSINKEGTEGWPSVILRPNQTYHHVIQFKFKTE
ncbi:MAG: galactose mutarotase [Acidobacteriia bacterium]|nr:galactose mutarotase [Terriglobia bacterium]